MTELNPYRWLATVRRSGLILVTALGLTALTLTGSVAEEGQATSADGAAAVAALDAFHQAITEGEGAAALALLAEDMVIVESGEENASRADYADHHLPADMAFSATMKRRATARTVHAGAKYAWILSSTRTTGTYKGRAIDSMGKETVVLEKRGGKWLIVHLHSSTPRRRK